MVEQPTDELDAATLGHMSSVIVDAQRFWVVFLAPLFCPPLLAALATVWMSFRLGQWYWIGYRNRQKFERILARTSTEKDPEVLRLVDDFLSSARLLWIGALFWPFIAAGFLAVTFGLPFGSWLADRFDLARAGP
jgi:hypothetical protein